MVRRITLDEASVNLKEVVEQALGNGDSLEVERDGRLIGKFELTPVLPKAKKPLGQFLRELAEKWPDDEFGRDLEEAMRYSRSEIAKDQWED